MSPANPLLSKLYTAGLGGLVRDTLDAKAVSGLLADGLAEVVPTSGRIRLTSKGRARAAESAKPKAAGKPATTPAYLRATPDAVTGL